uniref:Uncharacterized protein n=1 Tax=Aegilops tauschii TaxID=37682 RepID=M8B8J2_AEGTA
MASSEIGRTPAQGAEDASASPWPLRKLQLLFRMRWFLRASIKRRQLDVPLSQGSSCSEITVPLPMVKDQAIEEKPKQNLGFVNAMQINKWAELMNVVPSGPRRFLYRNTLGRFKTEKDLLNDVEQSMIEYKTSIESLRKDSKYTLDKVVIGESDLQRGRTDLRSTGKQIQSVIRSIYKAESTAAGLMDQLRIIPTRQSLELRAEASEIALM